MILAISRNQDGEHQENHNYQKTMFEAEKPKNTAFMFVNIFLKKSVTEVSKTKQRYIKC